MTLQNILSVWICISVKVSCPYPRVQETLWEVSEYGKVFSPLVPSANPEASPSHYIAAHEQKNSLLTKVICPQRSQRVMRKL